MSDTGRPEGETAAPRRSGVGGTLRALLWGTREDFTSGSLNRGVLLLAIPMVLEMAGESLFFLVDMAVVSRLGANALAAIALTEAMLAVIYSVAVGLAMSTTAMVARRTGEKDERGAATAAVQAIALSVGIAVVLGLAGALLAPWLLRVMGGSPEVVAQGTMYARIQLGGMVVIILLFVNNAIYRGAGDPSMAMRSVWLANGINIVLDPVLVFGLWIFPELGLPGAAVATTTGRGIGALYQLWHLSRGERIRVRRSDLRVRWPVIGRLARVSVGGVGQMLVTQVSYIISIRFLSEFGTIALAGYTMAIRVVIFIILPAWGLANAAATLVGQNLGAGKPDRAERAVYLTGFWNMLFMAVVTVVFVAFPGPILAPFAPDPETLDVGVRALRIISYGYIFYAWGMVTMQAFNGAGDTATPTWINIGVFWFFQLPVAALLAFVIGWGETGVFWSFAVAYSLSAVVGLWIFRRGRWKQKVV
ncbi:MATE family efflux transporter [Candidatus Palauibacter polyketidifaciens]|uniref:MATE family efflux transporter n=1 Tax=Candidatus Palauibacter polyketidifaciens TaxID=3056740 RepID=UPI00239A2BC9|nr:MATE family efflux transporter [Candidatus Palauibacter polyketidifaciens]MDE2720267.1 MATE family efflux transporter [Candidatus Palauibacter polyketidifaciens]